tara:strand:+ start:2607 stop:4346 length:1740 start_codon:yes stop_codon:yes gene_type:complete
MSSKDLQVIVAALAGFVAFSIPLLYQDTKHIWQPPLVPPPPPPFPDYSSYQYPEEEDQDAKFRHACTSGSIAEAEKLLQEHGKELVTKAHWHGNTPIFEAARAGQEEMVKWLIEHGAAVDDKNEWGDSAANEAATMGHFGIVWFLADKGAKLAYAHQDSTNAGNAHNSLLLSAVRHRSVEALGKLKGYGVDLNTKHWNGNSALHEAARSGEKELIEWLIHNGADINATNDVGDTAVGEAATMGHFDVLWLLLRAGSNPGASGSSALSQLVMAAVRHSNTELLDYLEAHSPLDIDTVELHGNTALNEAARVGDLAIVEWLLRHGANVTVHSTHGEVPIHVAAFNGHFDVMWRLFEAGAPLNGTNENGGSVLMSAAFHDSEKEVMRLLANGLEADHSNERGDTPLSVAAAKGNVGVMRLLVGHGAEAKPRGRKGDTPLIRACRFRKLDAARYLIEETHVDIHVANRRGDTALSEAARSGKVEVAEMLLEHGAEVNHENKKGMTPFLEAADGGSLKMLKLLYAHKADPHKQSNQDDGARELARWTRDSDDVIHWLESIGVQSHEPEPGDDHEHDDHHVHGDD